MFRKPLTLALSLCVLVLFTACAKELSPQEVAEKFWHGVEQGDASTVKKHITAAEALSLNALDDVLAVSNPKFSRIIIDGDAVSIDTTITVTGDKPLDFPLKTYLVREDQQWKVDYVRTMDGVSSAGKIAAVIDKVQEFSNNLQQGIERSVQELEQTLPHIEQEILRFEAQIKERVPALRERLETFTKELEQALKKPLEDLPKPESAPPAELEESVEI